MEDYYKIGLRLIIFRLVIAITFLSSSLGLQIALKEKIILKPYFYFSAFVLFLELFYIFIYSIFKKFSKSQFFIYLQLIGDSITVVILLFYTGGHNSVFIFLNHFLVVLAGSLLKRRGAFLIALINSLLFGLLCLSLYYNWLRPTSYFNIPFEEPTAAEAFNALITNILGLLLIALLVSAIVKGMERSSTELGKAKSDLNYFRYLNDLIVSSISGGIIIVDKSGRVNYSNEKARELLNIHITEGWNLNDQLKNLGAQPIDLSLINKNKEIPVSLLSDRHFMFSVSLIHSEQQEKEGFLILIRDETEIVKFRKEMELKERLIALGELAANMAHEIKNPLGSISGAAQMLSSTKNEDREENVLLNIIHKESLRLAEVLDNFLKFANPQKPHKEILNIVEMVEEVVTLFKNSPYFLEKNLKLELMKEKENIFVLGDINQLKSALWNILTNARKASKQNGNIFVTVFENDNFGCIEVRDEGIGMLKTEIEKLQEPFKKGFTEGAGLGLAVVNRILEQHGGRMEIDSKYMEGTTVKIFIPKGEL